MLPGLQGSTAFANRTADNEARMARVVEQLALAQALLGLEPAVPAAAAAQLRSAALLLESAPGWINTRRQNRPAAFATTKLGLARQGIEDAIALLAEAPPAPKPKPKPKPKPEPEQSTRPAPATSVFSGLGWLAVRYDALFDPSTLAGAGVKWVAAVLSHGVNRDGSHNNDVDDRENQAWLAAGKAKPYRDAGILVGGWGWHEVVPETEATIAATHVGSFALDLWIANAEAVWKPDDPGFVANAPERYCAALETELRNRGLAVPVGWSVLGAPPAPFVYGYDYGAFTRRGWHILPQAYPQQSPEYELDNVVEHAVARAGIPPELVHPTIANYGPQKAGAFRPTIPDWAQALGRGRSRGIRGCSLWAHDWVPDDARALGRA